MDVRCTLLALGMRGCLQRTHDEDIEASHELHNILAGRDLALNFKKSATLGKCCCVECDGGDVRDR